MSLRETPKKVLIIGSGGIVIGQAAEFDYSGSQALKALREEGIETILVNPNVATIQTSLRLADKVYLEPLTPEVVAEIIRKEKPDGILLGFGGQTALNIGVKLDEMGVLEAEGVKVFGSSIETIRKTEDRDLFKKEMIEANVPVPISHAAYSVEEAVKIAREIGYPVILRPAYILGGYGSTVVYNEESLKDAVLKAIGLSLEGQVLVEQYLENWKEIEYEVMRDYADNCITVAALENFDPLGIHTGDSIVVAPTQTLTNREYHLLRSAGIRVVKKLKVVGECNIQFGLSPRGEDYVSIEVNARMSRSSALASKATGYPLAYIAAKLAIGYTLPELVNKVTGVTTACFEPALDYVVVKIPRWDFQKFPGPVDRTLGSQMKSVGEVMAIGRCFEEALQKAIRGLEIGKIGLVCNKSNPVKRSKEEIEKLLRHPTDERIFVIAEALEKEFFDVDEISKLTGIDRWFICKIKNIVEIKKKLEKLSLEDEESVEVIREAKKYGFSDSQIAVCLGISEKEVRSFRKKFGIKPSFKIIDTMAAEWASKTNYCYVTYGDVENDVDFSENKKKVLILGAGCIRIGSSVEFDYCTMNTAWSLKEEGIDEIIVLNNNPETVSTDYDMSDKLYFDEITLERVLDIVEAEKPIGVVANVGGQTSNNLALPLEKHGVKLLGTSGVKVDRAEDRAKFSALLDKLNIPQPKWSSVTSLENAKKFAEEIGYPVLVRPSYVLSGAAMRVANDEKELLEYIRNATLISPEYPVVISKFIEDSKEVEVDAVSDGEETLIGAIIEHIELAGTHSGDATMIIPVQTLTNEETEKIKNYTNMIAKEIGIIGPFNIQFLVKNGEVYVIELNLRASRSMPYTSKCTGMPLIYIGGKVMMGKKIGELNININSDYKNNRKIVGVKMPTFSFLRIKGADPFLGVEMTSTGEVACLDDSVEGALLKAFLASGLSIPKPKKFILISVREKDKKDALEIARYAREIGYPLIATNGTAKILQEDGMEVLSLGKISEGIRSIPKMISAGDIGLVINTPTPTKEKTIDDNYIIRRTATEFSVPVLTRIETAKAFMRALAEKSCSKLNIKSLNEYHKENPWLKYV
ncbi:MAG: carbamoyl-phosphate synthase (glutamine-hydrolyzing) large subunit [Candidatus Bathyarchaeota archaeon]